MKNIISFSRLTQAAAFNNRGFTVFELLIVMIVIGVLSSVLFLTANKQEKIAQLHRDAYDFAQNLREAQQMVMGAKQFICAGSNTRIFGLHIEKNAGLWDDFYTLFGDCNMNYQKDSGDLEIRIVALRPNVKVDDIFFPGLPSALDIVFEPPDPATYINSASSSAEAEIVLTLKDEVAQQRRIKVNTAGRIEVTR